jgi:hypothetical protein
MDTLDLLTPMLEGGIRNTNFFNGRLLTAEDLQVEQHANRQHHQQLGQAIGAGVVNGMEVSLIADGSSGTTPSVSIKKGLALNRKGQALWLPRDVTVALVQRSEEVAAGAGLFAECEPPQPTATGTGIYILVVAPASGFQERAPMIGLHTNGEVTACGSRYAVEGVRFRLVRLEVDRISAVSDTTRNQLKTLLTMQDAASLSKLRNMLAHLCLGTEEVAAFPQDPFRRVSGTSPYTTRGAVDALRSLNELSDCDVPLALIYWTTNGVQFLDMWSVRRRPVPRTPSAIWPLLVGEERLAEAEATFLQFQEQIEDLIRSNISQSTLTAIQATEYFRYLPPCGLVPVTGPGSGRGLQATTFFGGLVADGPTTIEGTKLGKLVHDSWFHGALDLTLPGMLQLYRARENQSAVGSGEANQLYLVFASRTLHDILEDDAVAKTFTDAWQVYRGLIKKRVFLPPADNSDAIGAQLALISAIQDVMAVAHLKAALAGSRNLGYQDALNAFNDLYQIQHELVLLFQSAMPGVPDTQGRESFAATLNTYLESAGPGGIPALKPAITQSNLLGAVQAQGAINSFVGSWSGQGAAIGYIEIRYKSSPRGTQLVPGDAVPYPHVFTVLNHTDRSLNIQLNGAVTAAHGDWTNSVTMQSTEGTQLANVTLASETSQDIIAAVVVPNDAQIGDAATLTVQGSVPAPHNKQATGDLAMTIAAAQGPPVVRSVRFAQTLLPAIDTDNVTPSSPSVTILTYAFDLRYAALEAPFSANFTFTVTLTATPANTLNEWFVDFAGAPRNTPAAGVFTTPVGLTANAPDTRVAVRVRTPLVRGPADKIVSFTVQVDSTDLPAGISAQAGPFNLRLRQA